MCGGPLTHSPEGNFTSPGYNGVSNYSRNLNCEWTLSNPNQGNSSIYIHFEDFYLEGHQDCQFDVLEFRVGEFNQGRCSPVCPQYSSYIFSGYIFTQNSKERWSEKAIFSVCTQLR